MSQAPPLGGSSPGTDDARSQARLDRWVLDALPVGALVLDADGAILACNPAATRLLGLTSGRSGRPCRDPRWQTVHEDGSPFPDEAHPAMVALRTGEAVGGAVMGVRGPDASLTWVLVDAAPLPHDSSSHGPSVISTFTDITEQQQLATAAGTQYRLLAENATDVVYRASAERLVTWVSPSVTQVLGWSPDELVGAATRELVHPEDRPQVDLLAARAYAGEEVGVQDGRLVFRVRTKSGSYRWMAGRITPLTGDDGTPMGAVGGLTAVGDLVEARRRADQQSARLRATLDAQVDPHVILDAVRDSSGRIVEFVYAELNPAACEFLGHTEAELRGVRVRDLPHRPAHRALLDLATDVVETGEPLALDGVLQRGEGLEADRTFDLRAVKVEDSLSFTWRDVTEWSELLRRLAESEEQFRLLAENAVDVITRTRGGRLLWVSPSVTAALGHRPEMMVGHEVAEYVHPDDLPLDMASGVPGAATEITMRLRLRHCDGSHHWAEAKGRVVEPASPLAGDVVMSFRMIDQQVALEKVLAHRAQHDPLTDLLNGAEARTRLASILAHQPRAGRRVAVAYADLDDLKAINDTHGHGAGDEALRSLAERLRGLVRHDDLVARVGGDEFLIVLDGVRDLSEAGTLAARMVESARLPVPIWGGSIAMTLSIGVAVAEPGEPPAAVIGRADAALYRAKRGGRDQVVVDGPAT